MIVGRISTIPSFAGSTGLAYDWLTDRLRPKIFR